MRNLSYTIVAQSAVIENKKILSPAVIQVTKGIITAISQNLPKKNSDTIIRLDDTILLPGFTNAHTHLELTNIGPLSALPFAEWMRLLLEEKKKQTEQDITTAIKSGLQKLSASGVTTVMDHVSYNTPLAAYKTCDLACHLFGEVLGAHPEVSRAIYNSLGTTKKKYPLNLSLTPHAVHSLSAETLTAISKKEKPPFSIHLCESVAEKQYFESLSGPLYDAVISRYPDLKGRLLHDGRSALSYLHQHHFPLQNSLVIHANYLTEEDLDILAGCKNICVVHCPGSFAFFRHDTFPFEELRKRNIKIALGTDSITSNSTLDYLHEILLFQQRYPLLDFFELLPMLTENACQAIGMAGIGRIQTGYEARLTGILTEKKVSPEEIFQKAANSRLAVISIPSLKDSNSASSTRF